LAARREAWLEQPKFFIDTHRAVYFLFFSIIFLVVKTKQLVSHTKKRKKRCFVEFINKILEDPNQAIPSEKWLIFKGSSKEKLAVFSIQLLRWRT